MWPTEFSVSVSQQLEQVTKEQNSFLFFILIVLRVQFICVTAVFISLRPLESERRRIKTKAETLFEV